MINLSDILREDLIVLVLFVFGYLIYFFSIDSSFVNNLSKKNNIRKTYIHKVIGFFTIGLIPLLITSFMYDKVWSYGLSLPHGNNLLLWCGIPIAFFFISSFIPRKNINTDFYPQARLNKWTKKAVVINCLIWCLYLLGYEYMFRGLLLFSMINIYGLIPAIIINSVIYSLVHIYKGKMEAFGAFFLGIVLCIITYYTNSMWVAYIVHIILALSNDFKAIKLNDEMKYV